MKKVLIILIIFILSLSIIFYFISKVNWGNNKIKEYTPAEEVTEEQLMQTEVSLYFKDNEKNTLIKETRLINAKDLITNPYRILIELLMSTPKSENLCRIIPEGTKINRVEFSNKIVRIDFSKEFIDNCEDNIEIQNLIVYSIVNTLTELTEVDGVKILINNEEDSGFKNNGINFKEAFVKID